ncbi:hypothetical protein A2810_01150 [candidate division Kazan bacterium RIFCSPHIGHO2_01_FULL_49_10]|uniref:HTH HARE-type domain-containing protein n=1 Tax=candidate division Kazan bacterium RIFCSPLOWO2_01_FULL_48_13 TaxID=1798539 RepID=A0A1F4PPG9_UNCK3|nr:MAG: hypothetical protein A2810_01150 [candidate division Kazan bacterium RIFCSPHIGHO2_01_FULL_49_10]OGB85544.1 MAG: hypothetical protein A2994_00780 [candidate division Kazan bacterium RIFCSPLOWO2_01_FULL_48_13]
MHSQNHDNQTEGEKPTEDSVLDRVMSESQSLELASAKPSKVVTAAVNKLRDRERDVLIARYGLDLSHTDKETLESIGKKLSVTRERVRQIENAALKKIAKKFSAALKPLWKIVDVYLTMHGNIADVDFLIDHFKLSQSDNLELEKNALRLAVAAYTEVYPIKKHVDLKAGWLGDNVKQADILEIQKVAVGILTKSGEPLPEAVLVDQIVGQAKNMSSALVKGALRVGAKLGMDNKNRWGLTAWPLIVPRRIRDKVFIILETAGKPLHFEEITKLIGQKFAHDRQVLSRTVHNELISDERFVLVGRGIYALSTWGYAPGVVSDVVKEVLQQAGQPMKIGDIVDEVLKRRQVKRNTIIANLQNRSLFTKVAKATYDLAQRAGEGSAAAN